MLPLDLEITDEDIRTLARLDKLSFDNQRSEILKSLNSIDIQACPGSGKTTLIAAKLKLLSQKWPYRTNGICVLSHTNVAKDEIINKIKNSNIVEARRSLSYPHFIGTIQDFIDRFLAFPLIRNDPVFTKFLENNDGIREVLNSGEDLSSICKSLYQTCSKASYDDIKAYLGSLFWLNSSKDIGFYANFGNLKSYKNDSTKVIYPKLASLKNKLIFKGYYQYRDMYAYADSLIIENTLLKGILQMRFPIVFIDEMQDTQKFQDDLLQKIFPLDSTATIVQRFGDPDQAIFNNINGEVPNQSYNGKSRSNMSFVIDKSHRFDATICQKVKSLSFNEVVVETDLSTVDLKKRKKYHSDGNRFKHTIFIYNSETIDQVIPEFAKLAANQFSDDAKNTASLSVKVIGAVGNEINADGELKIGHYWSGFDKTKSKKNFKESCLIEAVYFIRKHGEGDWAESYKCLNDCILNL